jgi:hypothetical protein
MTYPHLIVIVKRFQLALYLNPGEFLNIGGGGDVDLHK